MKAKSKYDRPLLWSAITVVACYLALVVDDVKTYRIVASERHGCCGFVSENRLARPVTYALIDEWTTPAWTVNGDHSERWLTVDGLVNGERKFWRILQREPVASVSQ